MSVPPPVMRMVLSVSFMGAKDPWSERIVGAGRPVQKMAETTS
jgi:hypothetical protein